MGSSCCKSPNSPQFLSLGKFFLNCPVQLCPELHKEHEESNTRLPRKFSHSDISGPLPLGTVIVAPKRPPRRKKLRISRCHSVGHLDNIVPIIGLAKSRSIADINISDNKTNNRNESKEIPQEPVQLTIVPLVLKVNEPLKTSPVITNNLPVSPPLIRPDRVDDIEAPVPQLQQLISRNRRTFFAGLLEENNNLNLDTNNKDVPSRKSSITESLREFESSLYEMLQETAEDERSENSLKLSQVAVAR